MMENIWQSWVIVALSVPVFYALDSVLDVFFVGRKIFRDPAHATVLTGLFSIIFLLSLIVMHKQLQMPPLSMVIMSIANGMLYIGHIFFYFKILFKFNDASNLECFLGFSVILVPVFAYFFLGEKLTSFQHLGIGISLIGVIWLFIISAAKNTIKESFVTMSYAVSLLSLSYVIQDKVYQQTDFYTGLMLFLVGQIIASLLIWKIYRCPITIKQTYKFGPLFLISQLLGVVAVVFSQRAISISPSVTFVVAIETTTPLFIMLFSFIAIEVLTYFSGKQCYSILIFKLQLNKLYYKLFAFCCILIGVALTSSSDFGTFLNLNFHAIASSFD